MAYVLRNYQEALEALDSLQSNSTTLQLSQTKRRDPALHTAQVATYLRRVGLELDLLEKIPIIHITGTKGKGSTGAFCESILLQYGYRTGFYNSPHLLQVNERIRLSGKAIDDQRFSRYFWQVYDGLQNTKDDHEGDLPFYFAFLTVMAFYVFCQEPVDVIILEVGIGGRYDTTNVVRKSSVCGITSLDLDHTSILGNTLEEIAWQKAGIFKPGVPAFTVEQNHNGAMEVLLAESKAVGCPLFVVSEKLEDLEEKTVQLGFPAEPQAAQLENSAQKISRIVNNQLYPKEIEGLACCHWPGRYQTISQNGVTYYLDGAHTPDSMKYCAEWFSTEAGRESDVLSTESGRAIRALLFNITGNRQVPFLVQHLKDCGFSYAAFCPNKPVAGEGEFVPDEVLSIQTDWDKLHIPKCVSGSFLCVQSAMNWVKEEVARDGQQDGRLQVLVTGSLYLVAAALRVLAPDSTAAPP